MILITPAILDKTPEEFKKHVEQLKNSSSFGDGWVHIDFADNKFVPNQTISPDIVENSSIDLKKEAHLMVQNPGDWISALKKALFARVIFHIESADNTDVVINSIKQAGMEVGIAIRPETSIEELEPYKNKIDQVLIMGIEPGFQGQPFIPATIDKIRNLKSKNWPVQISTDGAVKDDNARDLVEAGADQLISGSYLMKGDLDSNVEKLWEAIKK